MKKLMAVMLAATAFAGCVSVNKNDGARDCLQPEVVKDAVHMKYELGKNKVSSTETIHWIDLSYFFLPLKFSWGGTADHIADHAPMKAELPFVGPSTSEIARNGAYAKACAASSADSLVASRYKVTNTSYFVYGVTTAEVSGYPAKVTDVELIKK